MVANAVVSAMWYLPGGQALAQGVDSIFVSVEEREIMTVK
jgi:hypothetical protein